MIPVKQEMVELKECADAAYEGKLGNIKKKIINYP